MDRKNKFKILLMLLLAGVPSVAQTDADIKKQEVRARNFADFMLYWSEWGAYLDITHMDKRRAERKEYEETLQQIHKLVQDSTYYANAITKSGNIINKRYSIDQKPDMPFFLYEIRANFKDIWADKKTEEYILGKNLKEYERTVKSLILARYAIQTKQK